MGCKKIVLMLSYPSDEVGNHLIDLDLMDEKGVNPWSDVHKASTENCLATKSTYLQESIMWNTINS